MAIWTQKARKVSQSRLAFGVGEEPSRGSQVALNSFCERMRFAEYAPGGPIYLQKYCHGLAEISKARRWQVELQYLVWHRTHRGASWASGAAQAAQVVRIILLRRGVYGVGEQLQLFGLLLVSYMPLASSALGPRQLVNTGSEAQKTYARSAKCCGVTAPAI